MNRTLFSLLFLIAPLLATHSGYGSDDSLHVPKAILVQLGSEQNRIVALTKNRMYDKAAEVQKDAVEVQAKMKLDFHDNFALCPVYYFVDTNVELIRKKQFDGALFNSDGLVVKDFGFTDDYLVVYYGYPASQSDLNQKGPDSNRHQYDSAKPQVKGLVILNSKLVQINFVYKFGYFEAFTTSKENKKYCYDSKHFDIKYSPCAERFSKILSPPPNNTN